MTKTPWFRLLFMGLAIALLALSVLLPALTSANTPDMQRCGNLRSAADSLFVVPRPELACVDTHPRLRAQKASQLRQILDSRALRVPVPSLPQDPDFRPDDGGNTYQLLPTTAPWLVMERKPDGRWVYSQDTMNQVPELHRQTFSWLSLTFQENLPAVFHQPVPGIGGMGWQWALGTLLVIIAVTAGLVMRLIVLNQLKRLATRLKLKVDSDTFRRLDNPVMVFVIGAIVAWRLPDIQLDINTSSLSYLFLSILLGVSGVLIASRVVDVLAGFWEAHAEQTESRLDSQLVPLVRQIARVIVWVVGVLFVLQNNGVQVWSFIAGLGIGSLAFALAAQDTIANLFGAVNIFLDKPFQVGDWVRVGSVEGTVEEVGFRSFRVRTFYNSLVTIPNSTITNTNVDNLGARHRRRVRITLGLTYDTPPDKLQAFVEGVRAILSNHPKVQKSYEVHFFEFGASSLNILVQYHVIVDTWSQELETRAANFLEFLRLAEALGVSFAFPSTSVYLASTPEHPMAKQTVPSLEDLEATAASFGPQGERARPLGPQFTRSFVAGATTQRGEGE
ncbi:MAG: mechanosensitive ion channel family protein [Deltaproteobacteria bacterium]|nr:MAG: mechanosensitive ion channel family protein [Deltaproteobacteria bacterium]